MPDWTYSKEQLMDVTDDARLDQFVAALTQEIGECAARKNIPQPPSFYQARLDRVKAEIRRRQGIAVQGPKAIIAELYRRLHEKDRRMSGLREPCQCDDDD